MSYFLYSKLFTFVFTPATDTTEKQTRLLTVSQIDKETGVDISVLTPTRVMEWILFEKIADYIPFRNVPPFT